MRFINKEGCIVQYELLEKAIEMICEQRAVNIEDVYKITQGGQSNYYHVNIAGKIYDVHKLIGCAMVGVILSRNIQVHHIDGNKANNEYENLQIMSRALHTSLHGRISQQAKGSPYEQIKAYKQMEHTALMMYHEGMSKKAIYTALGIHHATLNGIISRHKHNTELEEQ